MMKQANMLKKVFVGTVSAILIGTSLPAAGYASTAAKPAVSSNQLMQDIFARVGLKMPQSISSQNQTSTPAPTQANRNPSTPAVTPSTPPANTPSVNRQPVNNPAPATHTQTRSQAEFGDRIIRTGEKYLGTPYRYGARSGQTRNFDCSSFVQYVFGQNGVKLPRTATQQSYVGKYVPRNQLQKGDLVFFKLRSSNGNIGHVGIYAGNGKLLHTWGPGGVRYDNMSASWLDWGYLKATRITPPSR
jgi:cell wall-associated NlpC family hydrolase